MLGLCPARALHRQYGMLSLSGSPRRPAPPEPLLVLNDVRVVSNSGTILVLMVRSQRLVVAKDALQDGTTVSAEGDCGRAVLTERYANALGVL
jgi:hypothetical protein